MLRLPEEEGVALSGPVAKRLVALGDGDAALLYIAILRRRGAAGDDVLRADLGWSGERLRAALDRLRREGLVSLPGGAPPDRPSGLLPPESAREYTREDMARALEGGEFAALAGAVEEKLGKRLTTPDVGTLLGLYDALGLPADVIFLLVSFCCERTARQYGPGRRPTLRQIEKEGYVWARLGLMTQEAAAAHIRKYQRERQALPEFMRALRLGDREPSPSEEKYLLRWLEMGFGPEAAELAYDRTVLKCGELKWPYMDRILESWHGQGLHTVDEIEKGDRPRSASRRPRAAAGTGPRDDMARMEKYLQKLREQEKG